MKRFPWILTLLVVPLLVFLIGLGVWQVQRLAWKNGLIAGSQAVAADEPVPLSSLLTSGPLPLLPEFQRVIVTCDWPVLPYVELQTIRDGQPGVRLISECQGFLIDRGFIADTISARPGVTLRSAAQEGTPILAQVRDTPGPGSFALPPDGQRFYARDNPAMGRALGVDRVSTQTLFALETTSPGFEALQPSAPPAAFSNNHLGYAITWFGLAIVLVGFYVALLRRRIQKDPS